MNIFKQKIRKYRELLFYKGAVVIAFIVLLIAEGVFTYVKITNNNKQIVFLENKTTFSGTQQNKMIFENSLITKADAMYHNFLIKKNLTIESYVESLRHILESTATYYDIPYPIKVTVSYNNAKVGEKNLTPIDIKVDMYNIYDYTPIRVAYNLFNNTMGTMDYKELSISREYTGDMFVQAAKKRYLFTSSIRMVWFILLKASEKDYIKTFSVKSKYMKDLEKIDNMYNMSTWDESFMLFPDDIEKLKEIQRKTH